MREWLSWWSATLPRSRPRVRVPSRAFVLRKKGHPVGCLFLCKKSPVGLKQHSMNAVRGLGGPKVLLGRRLFIFILLVKWSGVLYTVHDMEKFAAVSGDHISGGKKQSRKESRCVQYVFG